MTEEVNVDTDDQLLMKARKSVDKTNESKSSSSRKLILVHGYIKDQYKQFSVISNDIILLIYYFYDIKLQRSYLSPYYYRAFYISRPLGLAVCEKLETKYICMIMANSPGGQLGLRAGSQIIAYNNYIFDENDIDILQQHFIETKNKEFNVKKDIKSILSNNGCLPLTLYLKYDPIELLQKMDESINNNVIGRCNFFGLLHKDTLRWAIDGKVECYKINDINGCDVLSILPSQSDIIQNNILREIGNIKDIDDLNKDNWNKIINKYVKYDDVYFKTNHVNYGDIIKTYGKAGCYVYCVRPFQGWIKFMDTNNGIERMIKYDDDDDKMEDDNIGLNLDDDNTMSIDSKYHFEIIILTKYIRQCLLSQHLTININDDESDDYDRFYDLIDILNGIESRENETCFKVIYLMNSMSFTESTKKMQENHIKKLINITNNINNINKNKMELLIITIQHNVSGDYNAKLPIIINGVELRGYIVGRVKMEILKQYDLYDQITSFRCGILFIGPQNQIFIRPKEVINDSIFRKIKYLIQGRRLSKIKNLLNNNNNTSNTSLPFITRTLSVELESD